MNKKIAISFLIIVMVFFSLTGLLYADSSTTAKIKSFHIISNCNKGGIITPKGKQTVTEGSSVTFTISADNGYKLSWVRVDNKIIKDFNQTTYSFTDVVKNHTIQAHFVKIKNK